jgi:BirA family transcriptional regulator, biotin operon repressor / biotin---[acetyl-CoA-carboxylase] ligase
MSFIIRPRGLYRPEFITLISAVAVVEGIKMTTDLVASIRWPNDVVRGGRKLAGIIADAQTSKQEITQVIVGVGVNCNTPVSDRELSAKATSLSEELGREVAIPVLKLAILGSFADLYDRWQAGEDMVPVWTNHISTLGRRVTIKLKTTETPFSCIATEVDLDGGLLVETEGETVLVRPEDLEWLREEH